MSWIDDGSTPKTFQPGFVDATDLQDLVQQDMDLALRVADSGWQNLTINPGATNWSAGTGQFTPQWRQVGSLVMLTGNANRSVVTPADATWNGANIFNSLPAAARPANPFIQVATAPSTNGAKIELKIDTDGGLQVRNTGTTDLNAGAAIGVFAVFLAG